MMTMTVYVGNLPFSSSNDDIKNLLLMFGEVYSVKLIADRNTGRPKGYGFVEMEKTGAISAIKSLDGTQYGGRTLRINQAQTQIPQAQKMRASM